MIRTYTFASFAPPPLRRRILVVIRRALTTRSTPQENRIRTELDPIRVASIPAAHPYVRAITDSGRVHVLADPPVPGAPDGQWWPPVALTTPWLVAHAADFDVLHVHFGLESFSVDQLRDAVDAAKRLGRPVVYTVHDIDNPQLVDQRPYRALLDVLIPSADLLITLTADTAAEIDRTWGRRAVVLPHPTLLEREVAAPAGGDEVVRVGIHLRDLRPNIAAEQAVRAAADAATLLERDDLIGQEEATVEVDVLMNERVRSEETAAGVVDASDAHDAVHVRRVPHLSDAEVERWLSGLDLFVLPYHHGTHSGWVELCYDLGVRVAGTDVGHIAAQHPAEFTSIDLQDARTLAEAVQQIATTRGDATPRVELLAQRRRERLAEREAVRHAHVALYEAALMKVASAQTVNTEIRA